MFNIRFDGLNCYTQNTQDFLTIKIPTRKGTLRLIDARKDLFFADAPFPIVSALWLPLSLPSSVASLGRFVSWAAISNEGVIPHMTFLPFPFRLCSEQGSTILPFVGCENFVLLIAT